MSKKILIVCTSNDVLGTTDKGKTGSWGEEVAAPYYLWKSKGWEVTIASIKGGEIPFDEASLAAPFLTPDTEKLLLDTEAMEKLTKSLKIEEVTASDYDAVFMPGGHGTCWDLPENACLIKQLEEAWAAGKIISAVCHGPVGLVNIKDSATGDPLVKGKKVTGFTDSEEVAVAKDSLVPFMLETRLRELGGLFVSGKDWQPNAVADGRLITGQNPQSSAAVAELVAQALST